MPRAWLPVLVGAAVVVSTFVLAQLQVFAPSAPAGAAAGGDSYRGEIVFERECARCHGSGGEGGGVGPRLADAGLDASRVAAVVEQGRGVMPPGIVTGQELADVAAYIASISSPSQ
ncbi:MAG TPA: cytochrome c [Gaiellaceae bacterium]|nr:cytochrome c [Gaiellaceae bacterium]